VVGQTPTQRPSGVVQNFAFAYRAALVGTGVFGTPPRIIWRWRRNFSEFSLAPGYEGTCTRPWAFSLLSDIPSGFFPISAAE